MNTHQKRVLTGLIALPVVLFIVLLGTKQSLGVFVLLLTLIGLWEFYGLFWKGEQNLYLKILGLLLSLPIIASSFLGWQLIAILIFCFWILCLVFLSSFGYKKDIAWQDQQIVLFGLFYIPLILQMFLNLQKLEIIFVLLLAVVSDTGAYYTGTYLGDKRIWPQISPNKSWAGAIGGLVFTVIICLIFGLFWGKANWYSWILVATVLNIAAQLGDFFESALKRLLQVKDSGNLLPGHGGLLDRIDSILLVLPVYVFLKTFLQLFNTT